MDGFEVAPGLLGHMKLEKRGSACVASYGSMMARTVSLRLADPSPNWQLG